MYSMLFIITSFIFVSSSSIYHHFTIDEIVDFQNSNKIVLMLYYNEDNNTHQVVFDEYKKLVDRYVDIRENYTFGYVDSVKDAKMLRFFKLKEKEGIGFIVYIFKEELFYFEENVTDISQVEDIIGRMERREINWYSNGVVERIFDYIAGKRLGQKAYTYFTIIAFVTSVVIYVSVNIWAKRMEKNEGTQRVKQD